MQAILTFQFNILIEFSRKFTYSPFHNSRPLYALKNGNYETGCSILAKTKITKNCLHTLCSILNVIVSLSLITIAGWYQVLGCIKNAMVINLSGLRETVCFINKHPLLSLSKNSLFHNSLT